MVISVLGTDQVADESRRRVLVSWKKKKRRHRQITLLCFPPQRIFVCGSWGVSNFVDKKITRSFVCKISRLLDNVPFHSSVYRILGTKIIFSFSLDSWSVVFNDFFPFDIIYFCFNSISISGSGLFFLSFLSSAFCTCLLLKIKINKIVSLLQKGVSWNILCCLFSY